MTMEQDRQAVLLDAAADIADHAVAAWDEGAVGGLKLVMDQRLLASDAHADQTIGAVGLTVGCSVSMTSSTSRSSC